MTKTACDKQRKTPNISTMRPNSLNRATKLLRFLMVEYQVNNWKTKRQVELLKKKKNTVLGPIPLKRDNSALTSSTDKSRKYSIHNWPLLSRKQRSTFLMQEALVGARPPHRMAFSRSLDSALKTFNTENGTV